MEVIASIKEIKMSAHKLNLVAQLVRRKSTQDALAVLQFSQKRARFCLIKLINSCICNAVNNKQMNADHLYIKELLIGQGRTAKRQRPCARGRSARILKRTARAKITLCEEVDLQIKTQKKSKRG